MRHCTGRMCAYALCLWVCAYMCRVSSEPQSAVEWQKTLVVVWKNNDDNNCHQGQGAKNDNTTNRSKTNTQDSFLVLVELSNRNGVSPMVLFESSTVCWDVSHNCSSRHWLRLEHHTIATRTYRHSLYVFDLAHTRRDTYISATRRGTYIQTMSVCSSRNDGLEHFRVTTNF